MKQRFPLALPVLLTTCLALLTAEVCPELLLGSAAGLVMAVTGWVLVCLRLHGMSVVSFCAAMGLVAGMQLGQMLGSPPSGDAATCRRVACCRAMADGIVEEVLRADRGSCTYVLQCELDPTCSPCVRLRCMVRETIADSAGMPRAGERRIATGWVRLPLVPTLEGEFSERSYARSLGCAVVLERARSRGVAAPVGVSSALAGVRSWIRRRLAAALDVQSTGIAMALLIGDRSMIDAESRLAYRLSGTAHIFSVSGSHVAIITWLVLLLIGPRPQLGALMSGIAVICAYTVLSGAEPPAVRSAIMGVAAVAGRRYERDVDALHLLMVSVLLIITLDPLSLISAGFFLSVSATLSLILGVPIFRATLERCTIRRRPWKGALANAVAVSWSATIGVSVPGALTFGTMSLTSPVANLIVVPIMSAALVLSLGTVLAPLPFVAQALAWWLMLLVRSANAVADFFAVDVLSGSARDEVMLLAVLVSLVMIWPLIARSWLSLGARIVYGTLLVGAVMAFVRSSTPESSGLTIIERRNGILLVLRESDTTRLAFIGLKHGSIDNTAVGWARAQRRAGVVGLGPWGRRMKGAIQNTPRDTLQR